jgi:hypothetical protein
MDLMLGIADQTMVAPQQLEKSSFVLFSCFLQSQTHRRHLNHPYRQQSRDCQPLFLYHFFTAVSSAIRVLAICSCDGS